MAADLELKQKEQRSLRIVETNTYDLTGAEFKFGIKDYQKDTSYSVEKVDTDFDKSDIALGIVYVTLTETNLDLTVGTYWGELKISLLSGDIIKTSTYEIKINRAIITD